MNNIVLAQVAALPEKSTAELKQLWRDLYDREPPPYNRQFLIKRLAYRIQELAYGGLSARAEAKLKELIEEEDRRVKGKQPVRKGDRPIVGTRLIREWQGVEHCATVLDDGFEYQGSALQVALRDRACHHRHKVERAAVLGTSQSSEREVTAPRRKIRCAIYTRVSADERLDMEFNSLDAQREAALAYVQSQKDEGWILVGDRYDDGGFSGGTMDRPALQRLLRDVESGRIDVIVVYKVDRLSRSLTDFARIVDVFDKHNVSFVSITQQFNTTTSMGRLTLNILLSFAQFEREVIGERIRDKFSASRRKGMWMGGTPPLGYDVRDRKLVVNEKEAELVRLIFKRFLRVGSATKLAQELRRAGHTTKSWTTQNGTHRPGKPMDKGVIYKILNNRTYLGEAVHKGTSYPGEHAAIINRPTWDKVQTILAENTVARSNQSRTQTPALLRGLIFAPGGHAMTPTHTRKAGKLYRYYVATDAIRQGYSECPVRNVPAAELEEAVVAQVRHLLRTPEIIARTWAAANSEGESPVPEREVVARITEFAPLWDELFPAEQARIVWLLVERADLAPDGMQVRLRADGLQTLVEELQAREVKGA